MFNIHEAILEYLKEEEKKDNDEKTSNEIDDKDEKISQDNKADTIIDDIINYSKKYALQLVDNRRKGGALWVYHDKDNTIHALEFKQMGMRYKVGRGWWIK